jgi:type I restriction enzyme S subunit
VKLSQVLKLEYGKALPDVDRDIDGLYAAYGANGEKSRTNKFLYDKPSIIVGRKGSAGELTFVKNKFWALDVTYYVTHNENESDLTYLYYALKTKNLTSYARGVKPGINRNDVYELEIPLPPLATQQKIVAKLDAIFVEIDKATAAAEANSKNAEALFHSYLTQVFELGGEGWITTVLDKVCKVDRGSSPRPIKEYFTEGDEGVNWIKIGDTEEGGKYIFSTNQKITRAGAEKSRYVEVGDFILTNSMSYGRPYIMRINGYIHDGWFVLRLNKDIDSEYFFYLLTSPYVQNQFQSLAAGSVVKNISGDLVKKTILPIPPLLEQKRLAEIFSDKQTILKRLSEVYVEKISDLNLLKQSILKQAFSGELVRE